MKTFSRGDAVYIVTPERLTEERPRLNEPAKVVFDHLGSGLAYIVDEVGMMHEIAISDICVIPEGHVFDVAGTSNSEWRICAACVLHSPKNYVRPLTVEELSLLIRDIGHQLQERHHICFAELLEAVGLSEFTKPIPVEIWRGVARAIADASGYRVTMDAPILEPVSGNPDQDRIIGYRAVASVDPTLFVKPAE